MKIGRYLILAMMVLVFAGCSSKGGEKPGEADMGQTTPPLVDGTTGSGVDGRLVDGSGINGAAGSRDASGAPMERVVYFDFDQSDIRADARQVLEAHAQFLAANPLPVRLEGHADERGSREYNLALGERRAQAVKRTLEILGVPESLLTTLSYGEERPVAMGHDESAWQLNRRVELIYP